MQKSIRLSISALELEEIIEAAARSKHPELFVGKTDDDVFVDCDRSTATVDISSDNEDLPF